MNARELVHDLIEFAEFLGAEVLVVLGEALGCTEEVVLDVVAVVAFVCAERLAVFHSDSREACCDYHGGGAHDEGVTEKVRAYVGLVGVPVELGAGGGCGERHGVLPGGGLGALVLTRE